MKLIKKLRVYPWSERDNPKPNKFVSMSGKTINTLPPRGMEYWARLSAFINNNPVQERDRFFMAMLKPLGIEKGKPFKPDARQRAILEEAARMGDAMGRERCSSSGHTASAGANAIAGTNWNWVLLMDPDQETENYSQLDERLHYTYGAIYTSPGIGVKKAGPGSQLHPGVHGQGRQPFRRRQVVPAARACRSAGGELLVADAVRHGDPLHDPEPEQRLGPLIATTSSRPTRTARSISTSGLRLRAAGKESNWIETLPGKGFYPMMRFYSPKAGLFDGTWKLPDVELMQEIANETTSNYIS